MARRIALRTDSSRPPAAGFAALARRYALLLGVAAAALGLDQAAKALATALLQDRPPLRLLGGLLWLDYTRNTGAAFSLLPSGGRLFEIVAVAVGIGILLYYPRVRGRALLVRIALGLILGGGLGNLLDRVRLGYVVDFIDLRWWPVFNLADSAIVVGVALLLLRGLWESRTAER